MKPRETYDEQLDEAPLGSRSGYFCRDRGSYAQWSNPADDIPAYHPAAPLKVSALPPRFAPPSIAASTRASTWKSSRPAAKSQSA
jgi:hypothetical protein